jgi:hypothetical protein
LNDLVEFTAGDIQKTRKTAMLFTLPAFSGMILMVRDMMTCACPPLADCQGFGVAYYSLTLGRLGSTAPSAFATLGSISQQAYSAGKIKPSIFRLGLRLTLKPLKRVVNASG